VQRVAKAWLDMVGDQGPMDSLRRQAFGRALFKESILCTSSDGLIVVRDIPLAALSQQNLLPFYGRCHIGYVPTDGRILGLSKLARATRFLSLRIQTPEKLANDLMDAVAKETGAKGVAVFIEATVMGNFGESEKVQSTASCGCFAAGDATNGSLPSLNELMLLLGVSPMAGTPMESAHAVDESRVGQSDLIGVNDLNGLKNNLSTLRMANAVETLLTEVGADLSSDSLLKKAARRYVAWLIAGTSGYKNAGMLPSHLTGGNDLGPSTPDNLTGDSTDTSLEDFDADMDTGACCVNIRADRCHASDLQTGRLEVLSTSFTSQCEHHLLPFHGSIKIVFPTKESVATMKDLGAMFRFFVAKYSRRLQVQERFTQQIADAAFDNFGVASLLVICESTHMCMVARGVEVHASQTLTTAVRGLWAETPEDRCRALDYVFKTTRKGEFTSKNSHL
jgi:GTP cyclohydrolase I